MTTNTFSRRQVAVPTTKKSMATMAPASIWRKVRQVWEGPRLDFGRHFRTVDCVWFPLADVFATRRDSRQPRTPYVRHACMTFMSTPWFQPLCMRMCLVLPGKSSALSGQLDVIRLEYSGEPEKRTCEESHPAARQAKSASPASGT
jgi:hypothetical protein